jgi:uncharacterized protein
MNRLFRIAVVTAVAAASVPAVASAHVTLQPDEVPAGEFKRLDVRVPNERDNASTKKVDVKFPPGFIFVSTEPVAGWTATVRMAKLDKPVEAHGEQHREQVDTVTFATKGKGVRPGQFQDFGLSVGLPDRPDTALTFKAIQTYSNGEVVRWIGTPDSDKPQRARTVRTRSPPRSRPPRLPRMAARMTTAARWRSSPSSSALSGCSPVWPGWLRRAAREAPQPRESPRGI